MILGIPGVRVPVVGAPMAGGPTTPALVAAVGAAGGVGTLHSGYLTAQALAPLVAEAEELTSAGGEPVPYGVNIFLPGPVLDLEDDTVSAALGGYAERLDARSQRVGRAAGVDVAPAVPSHFDEDVAAKIDLLAGHRPAFVSFTFGDPGGALVDRVHREVGAQVFVTVTSIDEARAAVASGADAVIAQGFEAGGHRGIWFDDPALEYGAAPTPVADLVTDVVGCVDVPVIAAGGIVDGARVAELLALGAAAAQVGTALLDTDEAGTGPLQRRALRGEIDGIPGGAGEFASGTMITRAYSGRPARTVVNGFALANPDAPALYPYIHYMSKPMRAAATAHGDADTVNLWAGTGWRSITRGPAGEVVARLDAQMRASQAREG